MVVFSMLYWEKRTEKVNRKSGNHKVMKGVLVMMVIVVAAVAAVVVKMMKVV